MLSVVRLGIREVVPSGPNPCRNVFTRPIPIRDITGNNLAEPKKLHRTSGYSISFPWRRGRQALVSNGKRAFVPLHWGARPATIDGAPVFNNHTRFNSSSYRRKIAASRKFVISKEGWCFFICSNDGVGKRQISGSSLPGRYDHPLPVTWVCVGHGAPGLGRAGRRTGPRRRSPSWFAGPRSQPSGRIDQSRHQQPAKPLQSEM